MDEFSMMPATTTDAIKMREKQQQQILSNGTLYCQRSRQEGANNENHLLFISFIAEYILWQARQ